MTSMNAAEEILKLDTRGRVRTPLERRETLLDEFERSGLSGAKFAALVGIKYPTFAAWTLRRKKLRGSGSAAVAEGLLESGGQQGRSLHWVEAVMEAKERKSGASEAAVRVELPGGAALEISDGRQVRLAAQLLRALVEVAQSC